MLTSRRLKCSQQEVLAMVTTSSDLSWSPRLGSGGAEQIQLLFQSCLGKLNQVRPAPGTKAACLADRNPKP